jgi:hypothetical protein
MRRRQPAVAGLFYPAQSGQLIEAVTTLFGEQHAAAAPAVAVLTPHSGYVYSGRTAARVFAALEVPRRCIIVAPSHTAEGESVHGGSVCALGAHATPVGDVPVDEPLAAALIAECPYLEDDPKAHRREHAIEVVLPFLLARRPDVTVVPVVVAWNDWPRTRALGEALARVVRGAGEPVLLVASSDMNHFEPAPVADAKDRIALEAVARLDGEALLDVTRRHRVSMCGRVPTAAVLVAARLLGAARGVVVDYSHSGMVTRDPSQVVSYAGVIMR